MARRVIGFDAGGTKLLGGVVGDDLAVHRRVHRLLAGIDDSERLLDVLADAVADARAAAPDAEAVGFGIPSLIDRARGLSVSSVHLPLDGVRFGAEMEDRIGLPVRFDNDANCAMLAELRHGAARGAGEALMLTIGTGIGGAIATGGELVRGADGAAGELGHVVVDLDGPPCQGACPGRGCLEAVASGTAIGREGAAAAAADPGSALGAAAAAGRTITGVLVTELALDGDPGARGVIEQAGRRLGAGLTGMVNAFNPEVIVVGGGAMAAGELLLGPARAVVAERALRPSRDTARIVAARFAEEAGMLGAALLALERAADPARGAALRGEASR